MILTIHETSFKLNYPNSCNNTFLSHLMALANCSDRNGFISSKAREEEGRVLIEVEFISQAKQLQVLLPASVIISADTPVTLRQSILNDANVKYIIVTKVYSLVYSLGLLIVTLVYYT
jgi:hypothetical protein